MHTNMISTVDTIKVFTSFKFVIEKYEEVEVVDRAVTNCVLSNRNGSRSKIFKVKIIGFKAKLCLG